MLVLGRIYKITQGGWRERGFRITAQMGGKTRPHHNVIYVQFYVSRSISQDTRIILTGISNYGPGRQKTPILITTK